MSSCVRLSRFEGFGPLALIVVALSVYALEIVALFVPATVLWLRVIRRDLLVGIVVALLAGFVAAGFLFITPREVADRVHEGVVTNVEAGREHPRFTLRSQSGRLLVYEDIPVRSGDRLRVTGDVEPFPMRGFFGGFDYGAYLQAEGIDGILYAEEVVRLEERFTPYTLKGRIEARIATYDAAPYLHTFVLAERSHFDEPFLESVAGLGLSHLFAVSGLHVSFLALCVHKGASWTGDDRIRDGAVLVMLGGFLFLSSLAPSVVRASLTASVLIFNRRFKLGLEPVDIVAWLAVALLMWRPHYAVHSGFILSFSVSLTILLLAPHLMRKSRFEQLFTVSGAAFLVSLPLVLDFNGEANLTSVVLNVLLGPFLTLVILPLTYATFAVRFFEPVLVVAANVFEAAVTFFDAYGAIRLRFSIPPGIFRAGYYGLLVWGLSRWSAGRSYWRAAAGLVALCVFLVFQPLFVPYREVEMFDVRGDAFLVRDRHDRCNILIDTGEPDPHQNLVSALERKNIRRLDYVVLTHRHLDHYGAYPDIEARFAIGERITNVNQSDFEGRSISCGGFVFEVLPLEYPHSGENDRSVVLRLEADETYLFTGDIEGPRERTLLLSPSLQALQADVLKVPHHGSATSSSNAFLEAVDAEVALVPARLGNRFNHPSPCVIERLEARDIQVFRLDAHGSVRIRYLFGRRFKNTAN